jgi:hypothetical protein
MANQTQKLLLMLVIGVLLGATSMLAWKLDGTGEVPVGDSTPTGIPNEERNIATTTPVTIAVAADIPSSPEIPPNMRVGLNVADQPAGSVVFVTGLTVTENQWVAVYEENEGKPASILGASRVRVGYISTSVDLLRATEQGRKYFVAILNDDGDNYFNRLSDLPPFSPDRMVIVSFIAH